VSVAFAHDRVLQSLRDPIGQNVALAAVALVLGLFSLRGATGGERVLAVMTVFVGLGVLVAFGLLARGGTKSGGDPFLPL
jgi:hypothetical protein